MPDSSDAVMPGRSKARRRVHQPPVELLPQARDGIPQDGEGRTDAVRDNVLAREAMLARKPVQGLAQPHDAEGDERPRDRGTCRIGRVGPDPVRQDVGDDVGREGVADLVHSAMRRVLREPSLLDELELGAAPIPVPEPDGDEAGADGREFPSHGGEVIAQLAQRIKRRRGRGQILVARAGRGRRSSPWHARPALLRLPGAGCLQRLGRLRKSRCRTQRAKRVGHGRQTGDEGKRPHGSVHVGFERHPAHPPRGHAMHQSVPLMSAVIWPRRLEQEICLSQPS